MTVNASITDQLKPLKGAWLTVGLLFVIGFLNYLDRIMITTMRSSILEDMPMTDAQFGLLTAVFLWVYGILSPFAGYLADKFKRSSVIILSLVIWSIVTWLTAHAQNYEQLLATRALMGISEACYIPAALALIADYHKGSTRSLATGIHLAGVMLGQSFGFLGAWIAEEHHWTYAFSLFGIIGVSYAIFMIFVLKDPPRASVPENATTVHEKDKVTFNAAFVHLFTSRPYLLLVVFWGLLGIVGWMIMGWLPTYYKEHFNLTQTEAGRYGTLYIYPFSLLGVLAGGALADAFLKKYIDSRIRIPLIGLLIAAPTVFMASSTSVIAITVTGFAIYAFARVFSDTNMMPILCMISDKKYRATGYGWLNLFSTIVGGVGLYASGALKDAEIDFSTMFKGAAVLLLICAGILFLIKREIFGKTKTRINAIYLLPITILFTMGCVNQKCDLPDQLQQESIHELKTVLHNESKFVKVHAAEFLLWLNVDREEVKATFMKENEASGNEPRYRIGIWRVLAQAEDNEIEKKKWINKVLAVFADTTSPDRIHAAETLAKLKTSPLLLFPEATAASLKDSNKILNAYTQWATSFTPGQNEDVLRKGFIDKLLIDKDTVIRKISAYVLLKSKMLTQTEWGTIADRALAEPADSELKLTLLNTAFVTFTGSDKRKYNTIKNELLSNYRSFKADQRIGLAQSLADRGECEDIAIAETFLKNENTVGLYEIDTPLAADVRAYAAWAILAISQKNK